MFDILSRNFDLETLPPFVTRYALNEEYDDGKNSEKEKRTKSRTYGERSAECVDDSSAEAGGSIHGTDSDKSAPLPYRMVSVCPNKTLITSLLRNRSYDLINTVIRTKEDISAAIDTHTDLITLPSNISIDKGQLQKIREKRIYVNIPVFTNMCMLNTLKRYTDTVVLSTYAQNAFELRNEDEFRWFLRGMGMSERTCKRIRGNWQYVIRRSVERRMDGCVGCDDGRLIVKDYLNLYGSV